MLRAIIEFSLRFRGIVIALACLAVLYELYATEHASLGVFPEFAPPQVTIQTETPGLSPEQVETLVTQRIENALIGTAGLESIRSSSIQGLSVVTVTFADGTEIYQARQMVGERLLEIASQMPLAEKAKLADYVIDNSGDRAATAEQVRRVFAALMSELEARSAV